MIKSIVNALKSLIGLLTAGGSLIMIIIIIICFIGLLCNSVFGIFFTSQINDGNTIKDVVAECNEEMTETLEKIQKNRLHDEYVLDGNMASWRDVILIYTVKESKGDNKKNVSNMDFLKRNSFKKVFWDMNQIDFEVKEEEVTGSAASVNMQVEPSKKRVLHIHLKPKSINDMISKYNFNKEQMKQLNELSSAQYTNLWNSVIYGYTGSEDYFSWRQQDSRWSNIRVGPTTATMGDIGCLITSIAIIIEKSGVNTEIENFNPGVFLEELNRRSAFDLDGNLYYSAIRYIFPKFIYGGGVKLSGMSKEEKLELIREYINKGYYLVAEVKGGTPGNQHWVAINNVDGNIINMIDPGSNNTNMWNAYNYKYTSQFKWFRVINN